MSFLSYSACWDFSNTGACPRGDKCKWEHQKKLYPTEPRMYNVADNDAPCIPDESQFCWNYARTGSCPRGSQCRWIHELIMLPWPSPSEAGLQALPVDGELTVEQELKSEALSQISLPSERLQGTQCQYCKKALHCGVTPVCCDEISEAKNAVAKRKSWIIVQESLPPGLVSQIEGLYKRPITSSTNIQTMIENCTASQSVDEETRTYLLKELDALVLLSTRTI